MGMGRDEGGGETEKQHSLVDVLDLPELVVQLDRLEQKQSPDGTLARRDAVVRAAVERRILELVAARAPGSESSDGPRVPCDLELAVVTATGTTSATAVDLRPGGVFLATEKQPPVGERIELQVAANTNEHPLRVWGRVGWHGDAEPGGVGVEFSELQSDSDRRRLWRLIVRILHTRVG